MIAIAAVSPKRVIGAGGKIPWHLPGDLKFFKATTLGHVVLMGRKTWDSLGKPLPGRENWVVSRTAGEIAGARVLRSMEEIPEPGGGRELFVIGGAEIYEVLLPRCSELLLTLVDADVEGDAFFPEFGHLFGEGEEIGSGEGYRIVRHRRRGETG
jgi:dihydrofolate reductase